MSGESSATSPLTTSSENSTGTRVLEVPSAYVSLEDIAALTSRAHGAILRQAPYEQLVFEHCVLNDGGSSLLLHEQLSALGELMRALSPHLRAVSFAHSTVSGRVFYQGKQYRVQHPRAEHVTVESVGVDGEPVVRDDNPPLDHHEGGEQYRYVQTTCGGAGGGGAGGAGGAGRGAEEAETPKLERSVSVGGLETEEFVRHYVQLNWLRRLEHVNVSCTNISSHGITSLVAATAGQLQVLRMRECVEVDNKAMYSIVTLSRALRVLDIAKCRKIDKYGLLYLTEMQPEQCALLQELYVEGVLPTTDGAERTAQDEQTYKVWVALFRELSFRGCRGRVIFRDSQTVRCGENHGSVLEKNYAQRPDAVWDMTGNSIPGALVQIGDDGGYVLQLRDHLVNDRVLGLVLKRWGEHLHALILSGTLITDRGLAQLAMCPGLRILRLNQCWNILDKSAANRAVMPAITAMRRLRELDITDTRLSGRMLSEHPELQLQTLMASRCPISVHALRFLTESCQHTMHHLQLSGCDYLNTKAIHYFLRFSQLETLDLSYCAGLTGDDILLFEQLHGPSLRRLRSIDARGVPGMTERYAKHLALILTSRSPRGAGVSVLASSRVEAAPASPFRGPHALAPAHSLYSHVHIGDGLKPLRPKRAMSQPPGGGYMALSSRDAGLETQPFESVGGDSYRPMGQDEVVDAAPSAGAGASNYLPMPALRRGQSAPPRRGQSAPPANAYIGMAQHQMGKGAGVDEEEEDDVDGPA